MKRIYILGIAVLLVLSGALAANAVVINDPWPSPPVAGQEVNLFDIVQTANFGSLPNFGSSQAFVNNYGILQTLPPGFGTITAYAKYAGFTQQPGIYQSQVPGNNIMFGAPDFPAGPNGNFAVNYGFGALPPFGFLDDLNNGQYRIYTEPNLNAGNLTNAVIIPITANHMIVAFEDGAGVGHPGDQDYNDLVLNVTFTPSAPIPGSLLLLGSGILGMMGIGIRRKSS